MVIARYPRFGQLLAPAAFRSILDVPVPRYLVKRFAPTKLKGIRLAELDAASWDRFGPKACKALARAVIKQVHRNVSSPLAPIRSQFLPTVALSMPIDALPLETRTRTCLYRANLHEDARRLGEMTVGDMLALRGFGTKCLVDLLVSLEMPTVPDLHIPDSDGSTPLLPPTPASLTWIEWAHGDYRQLPRNAWEWTFPDLPTNLTLEQLDINYRTRRCLQSSRFGKNLSTLSGYSITRLLELPSFGVLCLRSLLRGLDAFLHPTYEPEAPDLETEVLQTFLPDDDGREPKAVRNRRIFTRFYGLDGRGGATLGVVGNAEGITKERVRQVCLLRRRPGRSVARLGPALQIVAELLPAPAAHIEAELTRRGLTRKNLPLQSLARFARALGQTPTFKLIYGAHMCWAVPPDTHDKLLILLVAATRQRLKARGAASVATIASRVAASIEKPVDAALARGVLAALPDFCWLDEDNGWFWLRDDDNNPLLHQVRKFLAAAGRLKIDELCNALRRLLDRRFDHLPPQVQEMFCRSMPGIRIEGDDIVADPPLDWRTVLHGIEREIVGIFREHGPLLHWEDLKKHGQEHGILSTNLKMALEHIPVIRHQDDGVYVLCGTRSAKGGRKKEGA